MIFRHTQKSLNLKENFSKMLTNDNYKVDLANLSVEKLMFEFAKELYFDEKALGKKYSG